MESGNRAELNRLVARWREAMIARSALDSAMIEELESHLWDEIDERIAGGASPREAVLGASARLGHADVLAGEFRKVAEWSRDRRPVWQTPYWTLVMWKNYLTIAGRNMRKQPVFSAINIGGLGLGLACAFLILLFVQHEWSYDTFHENADRIYRMEWHTVSGEYAGSRSANFPAGVVPLMDGRFPEIEHLILFDDRSPYLGLDGENRRIGTVAFMSNRALDVFSHDLLQGNPETALADPYSIILTETAARTLFGSDDPVGRTLVYSSGEDVTVTGVMADVPSNSSYPFEALAPMELMFAQRGDNADQNMSDWNYSIFALLRPNASPDVLTDKIFELQVELANGDEEQAARQEVIFRPITDVHTTREISYAQAVTIDPVKLYMFLGVAGLILLIAGVNFTNLATARATQRAREVGVRKTSGANRKQLAVQFLGESVLMSLVALALAVSITMVALPYFEDIVGSPVPFSLSNIPVVGILVAIGLGVGLLSGLYPALYLASFDPAAVLKGEFSRGRRGILLRKGLIVLQFGISVFLIISTVTIYRQLQHMQNKELGFDTEQVVFAPLVAPVRDNFEAFKSNLLQNSRIVSVTRAGNVPGRVNTSRGYYWQGQDANAEENNRSFYTVLADYGYLETLGLNLIAGRDFAEDMPADFENTYILNESAARVIGFENPEEAIGAPFRAWDRESGEVIGVVEDFHYQSLHEPISPVVINIKPWIGLALFRIAPGDAQEAVDLLTTEWRKVAAGYPMEYQFLDEDFDRLYRAEQDLTYLFTFFSVVAIFIACLGLFGLAAFSAQRRTKEIGVRKVLGADAKSIVLLLSSEFTTLVLVGFVIGAPVAWYFVSDWLDEFAYHTSMSIIIFAGAGLTALLIAWLTVSYQAITAARSNPVKSLRYE